MNVVLVSVRDALTGYSELRQAPSTASAIRSFGDVIKESQLISNHINDFSLYLVGVFDIDSGVITPQLEYLCGASDFMNGADIDV